MVASVITQIVASVITSVYMDIDRNPCSTIQIVFPSVISVNVTRITELMAGRNWRCIFSTLHWRQVGDPKRLTKKAFLTDSQLWQIALAQALLPPICKRDYR